MNGLGRNVFSHSTPTHRRAASDSFVVLEESSLHQDIGGTPSSSNTGNSEDFEVVKLSGDQLITAFMDAELVGEVLEGSPIPGDSCNIKGGEKVFEPTSLDLADVEKTSHADQDEETKRARRILANRQSAQRSRLRKLQYISDLEKNVQRLQEELHNFDTRIDELRMKKKEILTENTKLADELNMCVNESQYHEMMARNLRHKILHLQHCNAGTACPAGDTEQSDEWEFLPSANGVWEIMGANSQANAISDIYPMLGDVPE